jgi:hypothetical protein
MRIRSSSEVEVGVGLVDWGRSSTLDFVKRIDLEIKIALLTALVGLTAVLGWPKPLPEVRLPPEPPRRLPATQAARSPSEKPFSEPSAEEEVVEEPVAAPSSDGLVEQLSRRELQLPMEAIRPRLSACKGGEHIADSLRVRLRITRSGGVESASVLPPYEHSAVADCVRQIARTASFGRFRGTRIPVVELTYPVTFRE